jgi:hypothetical protein
MLTKLRLWIKNYARRRKGKCVLCARLLVLSRFNASGEDEDVSLRFEGLPCLSCGDPTHPKQYPTPDFGSDLINSLYFAGKSNFPGSRLKGLGHSQLCYSCGKSIAGSARPGQVSGVVRVPGALEFSLMITGPIVTCEFCLREQVYNTDDVSFHTNEAIIAAFKQIGLEPC